MSEQVDTGEPRFDIGEAVRLMKQGYAVSRKGWNGKDMFLYYVQPAAYPAQSVIARKYWGEGKDVPYQGYVAMKTVQGTVVPWLCSQSDLLADDWFEVEID